jgi:hypothetical protein
MTIGAFIVECGLCLMMRCLEMAFHAVPQQHDSILPIMFCNGMTEYTCPGIKLPGLVVSFNQGISVTPFAEKLVRA